MIAILLAVRGIIDDRQAVTASSIENPGQIYFLQEISNFLGKAKEEFVNPFMGLKIADNPGQIYFPIRAATGCCKCPMARK